MFDSRKDLLGIIQKYLQNSASPEEISFLESYYNFFDGEQDIIVRLRTEERKLLEEQMESAIWQKISAKEIKRIKLWPRIAAAASILIAVSLTCYFLLYKKSDQQIAEIGKQDLLPGGNKAVLFSGGRKIILTDLPNGTIAQHQNVDVVKQAGGKIDYMTNLTNQGSNAISYDTLMTKSGGTYQVKLSDGTQVWLNADSKFRYPQRFVGNERRVELISGEAYFEVAHNAKKPFRILTSKQEVEVLGTSFNVNAYPDDQFIKTTLIQGSIKLSLGAQSTRISPGQQAVVSDVDAGNKILIKDDADLDGIVAWKNGLFHFNQSELKDVMKEISRWYDVEVVYEGSIPHTTINGEVYRNMKASQLFQVLSYLKVNFRIEGKKIIVTNKK